MTYLKKYRIKILLFICCISVFTLLFVCNIQKRSLNESKKIETNIKKSESDIIEIVYNSLDEYNKKSIIDWKSAKVEEYKPLTDCIIGGSQGAINIKDKDTYKITFRTDNEGILGPITKYVDMNSYEILGGEMRD